MTDPCAKCLLASTFLLCLMLLVILVPMSLSHIEYYEYGLKKHRMGKVDTTKVYSSGRHLIGPSYTFVKYQADSHFVQITELSVFSSTPDDKKDSVGLNFIVDVDFTFLLIKNEIAQLHEEMAGSYETVIVSRAREAIKNEGTCRFFFVALKGHMIVGIIVISIVNKCIYCISHFCFLLEYFQERQAVEKRFREAIEKRWNVKPSVHCRLDQFHLGRIQIPDSVSQRQLETRLQNERNERESFLQQAQLERDLTAVEVNKINLDRDKVLRTAQAEAKLTLARATVQANQIRVNAEINGTQDLLQALNITTQEDVVTFAYNQALRSRGSWSMHTTHWSDGNVLATTTAA